jgi:hypothetical protein
MTGPVSRLPPPNSVSEDLFLEHTPTLDKINANPAVRDWLLRQITSKAYIEAGTIGYASCLVDGRQFELAAEGGQPFFVQPVLEDGIPTDLVAWQPSRPEHWYLRRDTGFALGQAAIDHAGTWQESLQLYPTPFHWVRAGCQGATILRPEAAAIELMSVPSVIVVDVQHGEQAERMLKPQSPKMPVVFVLKEELSNE